MTTTMTLAGAAPREPPRTPQTKEKLKWTKRAKLLRQKGVTGHQKNGSVIGHQKNAGGNGHQQNAGGNGHQKNAGGNGHQVIVSGIAHQQTGSATNHQIIEGGNDHQTKTGVGEGTIHPILNVASPQIASVIGHHLVDTGDEMTAARHRRVNWTKGETEAGQETGKDIAEECVCVSITVTIKSCIS